MSLTRYLERRGLAGPWALEGALPREPRGVVVIPSLAEGDELFATLDSLDANPARWRSAFAVVVVVNRPRSAPPATLHQNARDLEGLKRRSATHPECPLAWVDATTGSLALPERLAGVGTARKLGFDLYLDTVHPARPTVLASLDADTRVDAQYLETLSRYLAQHPGGCVVPFRHRDAEDESSQRAIELYELYMRSYVAGLEQAGSPYAHHALGSALACSSDAYLKAGGMNRRAGGEDFYFLQQLVKTSRLGRLSGTLVQPSPRPSQRAPFGTGRVVARQLAGEGVVRFHHAHAYALLAGWLRIVRGGLQRDGDHLLVQAHGLEPWLAEYLEAQGFSGVWKRLQGNFRERSLLEKGFHDWFDGLRTLRLVKASGVLWPSATDPCQVALQMGWTPDCGVPGMLARLRALQGAGQEKACCCADDRVNC